MGQSPTLAAALVVALALLLAVLRALVPVAFADVRVRAAALRVVVDVRLAAVRVCLTPSSTSATTVLASPLTWALMSSASRVASWRPVVKVALAERSMSLTALRAVVTAPLPSATVASACERRSLLACWVRTRLTSSWPRCGELLVGLGHLAGGDEALVEGEGGQLLDLLEGLGGLLGRAGLDDGRVDLDADLLGADAGVAGHLDGEVGDADSGEERGVDGLAEVLDD